MAIHAQKISRPEGRLEAEAVRQLKIAPTVASDEPRNTVQVFGPVAVTVPVLPVPGSS